MKRALFTIPVGILLCLMMISCSDKQASSQYVSIDENLTLQSKKDRALANRFIEYWDARSTHQFDKSYKYELPYDRYLKDIKQYRAELAVTLENYHVKMDKIEYLDADKRVALVYRTYTREKVLLKIKSKWIFVNGTWYRKYDFSLFPN